MNSLAGYVFDGRTAAAVPIQVTVAGGRLVVTTPAGEPLHDVALRTLALSDPFVRAPRQVDLGGGAVVEVTDGAALTAALGAAGRPDGLVDRLQQRWLAAVAALALTVGLLGVGYVYGLPALIRWTAFALPASAERRLGDGVIELLDGQFLRASTLPTDELEEVAHRLSEAARLGAPGLEYRLLFRSVPFKNGVNAFALPGGTVVILDDLVRRTRGDDRLVAVLGHELSHLSRHHATQRLLEAASIGALAGLLWGDFSAQAANVPAVLAMLGYSRDAEREADEDALRFLHEAGRTAEPLVALLCLLSDVDREAGQGRVPDVLSTHPGIESRLARVREASGVAGTCPAEQVPSPASAR